MKPGAGRRKGSNSTRSRGGFDRPITIYRGRDREYSLRESEVRTLTDLGRFRVGPEDDLARFGYAMYIPAQTLDDLLLRVRRKPLVPVPTFPISAR